jgi:rsbT co-antagonist protein RsbR
MAEGISQLDEESVPEADPRVAQILAAFASFSTDTWAVQLTPTGAGDALDQIIEGLNQLSHTISERRAATDQQFEAILEVMLRMLALDFTKKAPLADDGSTLDALAFGLNSISDELGASMVSRVYVDSIIESMLDPLIVLDADTSIQAANRAASQLFGYEQSEWSKLSLEQLLGDRTIVGRVARVAKQLEPISSVETTSQTRDGRTIPVALSASPMVDGGNPKVVCVIQDITERKQAEEALRQNMLQAEMIRAQAAAIAELSTPLIPITDDVVVMPLIGSLDSRRVHQVLETLLQGVATSRARVAILDITGVPVVDTQVANALIRAAQAVKLLGAQVVLTGIRPEIAQTLTGLGVSLQDLITRSSLQSGITFAINHHDASARQTGAR